MFNNKKRNLNGYRDLVSLKKAVRSLGGVENLVCGFHTVGNKEFFVGGYYGRNEFATPTVISEVKEIWTDWNEDLAEDEYEGPDWHSYHIVKSYMEFKGGRLRHVGDGVGIQVFIKRPW